MDDKEKKETERNIFEAAIRIFTEKGFAGSRMQEIADSAGINKALLHYYFRSKNKLFDSVFEHLIKTMLPHFGKVFSEDGSLQEKFESFFEEHISFLQKHPFLPSFVIQELNQNPDKLVRLFNYAQFPLQKLFDQIEDEQKAGRVKPIDAKHILINMLALSVFPFMTKPLMMASFNISDEGYVDFLNERKRELPKMMWDMIKVED